MVTVVVREVVPATRSTVFPLKLPVLALYTVTLPVTLTVCVIDPASIWAAADGMITVTVLLTVLAARPMGGDTAVTVTAQSFVPAVRLSVAVEDFTETVASVVLATRTTLPPNDVTVTGALAVLVARDTFAAGCVTLTEEVVVPDVRLTVDDAGEVTVTAVGLGVPGVSDTAPVDEVTATAALAVL